MKIAYIYLSRLETRDANINQLLSMYVYEALGEQSQVTLFSGWVSKSSLVSLCKFFAILQTFAIKTLSVRLLTNSMLLEVAYAGVLPNYRTTISELYTSPPKLFEYMAYGLPIVASNLSSMRDILAAEEQAFFFEPGDPRGLSAARDRRFLE